MHVVRGPLDLCVLASFILVIAVVFHTTPTARLVGTHRIYLFFYYLQEIIVRSSGEASSGLKACLFVFVSQSLEQSCEYADSLLDLVSDT